jgi:Zn-dependent oligopeptidase
MAKWNPWDFAYYANIYKKEVYDLDEDKLKEYFPAEHVKE